jgi:hypothetical protein
MATWMLTAAILLLLWVVHPLVAHADGVSTVAPADTSTSPMGEVLMMILKIVFSVLGVVATFLTTKAITYFQQKTNIAIPAAAEQLLFDWADQAVAFAYEKAHQVLQQTGKAMDGDAKMNVALQFIMDLVKKYNIDNVMEDKLKNYIEAKLGAMRIDAGGGPAPSPAPTVSPTPPAPTTETVVVAK